MPEMLSPADHILVQKAHQDLLKANAAWEFVNQHLISIYQVQPGDSVNVQTGIITRGVEVVPEPKKQLEKKSRAVKPAKPEVTD